MQTHTPATSTHLLRMHASHTLTIPLRAPSLHRTGGRCWTLGTKWYNRERRLPLPGGACAHCQLWRGTLGPAARRGKFQLPAASHAWVWLLELGAWEVSIWSSKTCKLRLCSEEGGIRFTGGRPDGVTDTYPTPQTHVPRKQASHLSPTFRLICSETHQPH